MHYNDCSHSFTIWSQIFFIIPLQKLDGILLLCAPFCHLIFSTPWFFFKKFCNFQDFLCHFIFFTNISMCKNTRIFCVISWKDYKFHKNRHNFFHILLWYFHSFVCIFYSQFFTFYLFYFSHYKWVFASNYPTFFYHLLHGRFFISLLLRLNWRRTDHKSKR